MAWLLYLHTLLEVHLCGMKEQAVERTRSEKKSCLAIKLLIGFLPEGGKGLMSEK